MKFFVSQSDNRLNGSPPHWIRFNSIKFSNELVLIVNKLIVRVCMCMAKALKQKYLQANAKRLCLFDQTCLNSENQIKSLSLSLSFLFSFSFSHVSGTLFFFLFDFHIANQIEKDGSDDFNWKFNSNSKRSKHYIFVFNIGSFCLVWKLNENTKWKKRTKPLLNLKLHLLSRNWKVFSIKLCVCV